MTGQTESYVHEKCISCGRRLFCAVSKHRGYGWGCWARIRKAVRKAMEALTAFTVRQVEQARELIEDAAIVAGEIAGLFHCGSTDGTEIYDTTTDTCSCVASKECYHRAAVAILAGA
jgi:hypothetical protein